MSNQTQGKQARRIQPGDAGSLAHCTGTQIEVPLSNDVLLRYCGAAANSPCPRHDSRLYATVARHRSDPDSHVVGGHHDCV